MHALAVIDMQTWMFRLPERLAQAEALVSKTEQLTIAFDTAGRRIYDVRTVHKTDRSTWSRLMLKYDYPCLLEGTPDADPIEGYRPPKGATEIIKTANSAFVATDFDSALQDDGITHLVLAGVFIDGCVGLTAADAAQRGYEVTFVNDAIGHTDTDLRASLFKWLVDDYEIKSMNTAELVRMLGSPHAGEN